MKTFPGEDDSQAAIDAVNAEADGFLSEMASGDSSEAVDDIAAAIGSGWGSESGDDWGGY